MIELKEMKKKSFEIGEILKTLSHPQRLLILCLLSDGEKNVSQLSEETKISQSQTSQFVIRMQKEGILTVRKIGNFSFYKIGDKKIMKLIKSLGAIYC